jgi:hypothetical protein
MADVNTSAACTSVRGGAYNSFITSTRRPVDTSEHAVEDPGFDALYMTETVTINAHEKLDAFLLGIPSSDTHQQGYQPLNALGLGFNSSFLNSLKSSGRIASKSWSFFWGRFGGDSNTQFDGGMVFGGYDKAKTIGAKYEAPLEVSSTCNTNIVVNITDIVLNSRDGDNKSIFPPGSPSAIPACVNPSFPGLMTMPRSQYFENFENITGSNATGRSFGLEYYVARYSGAEVP